MQSFISISFALRNRKIFIGDIIKIWSVTHCLAGILTSPADHIEVPVKFETELHASFMLHSAAHINLIGGNYVR